MQNEMSQINAEGQGAWGKIKIQIDGNQNVLNVSIDESVMDNREKLQDEMKNAFNDAVKNIQKKMATKMKEMGGFDAFKDMGL